MNAVCICVCWEKHRSNINRCNGTSLRFFDTLEHEDSKGLELDKQAKMESLEDTWRYADVFSLLTTNINLMLHSEMPRRALPNCSNWSRLKTATLIGFKVPKTIILVHGFLSIS